VFGYIWYTRGWTIKSVNWPPRACRDSSGQKLLVWFNDDISAFHSCVVVVDLWKSLSEWHLLLSACVLLCRRKSVGA
jgi:hypothetical protein